MPFSRSLLLTLVTALLAVPAICPARPIDELKQRENEITALLNQSRLAEAERMALDAVAIADRHAAQLAPVIPAASRITLSGVYTVWGRYADAERISLDVLKRLERVPDPQQTMLQLALTNLGQCYAQQERFAEAAEAQRRVFDIRKRNYGPNSREAADAMEDLALTLDKAGNRAEAEQLYKYAWGINSLKLGKDHPVTLRTMLRIGQFYLRESRLSAAEEYFTYLLDFGNQLTPQQVAELAHDLGEVYEATGRLKEAEVGYQQAMNVRKDIYGADSPLALVDSGLPRLFRQQGRLEDAAAAARQELAAAEQLYGSQSAAAGRALLQLAEVQIAQGHDAEARSALDRAVALLDGTSARLPWRCQAHAARGEVAWRQQARDQARADFATAMQLADEMRVQAAGAEMRRAQSFDQFRRVFLFPASCYLEAGELDQAFDCLERVRARSLLEQIETAHVDLLAGLPPLEVKVLRQEEAASQAAIASAERQIETTAARQDLEEAAKARELARLYDDLQTARVRLVKAYEAMRTASPRYRALVAREFKPVTLSALDEQTRAAHDLLLYYVSDESATWVLSIGGEQGPRVARLQVTPELAAALGIEPGELTAPKLLQLLADEQGQGVSQLISDPAHGTQAVPKLAALWQLLVPEADRQALLGKALHRLVVVPDGALSLLPFETLVTEVGGTPKYLLDVGPPVEYGPSASILDYLARRSVAPVPADREPVLAVGDPAYEQAQNAQPAAQDRTAMRARYAGLGGELSRLPFSAQEAAWVADVFVKQGIKSAILKERLATEPAVRANVAGRKIVHLACHGLVDQSLGNFFGALALTPPAGPAADPKNDGFLQLSELYELNLTSCELAILSACQTNYGPQQRGEGVWALTRGFLVAGSRRVVASNWLVDDEAAASIISYYCSLLAKQEHAGEKPDYAEALRDAKRWARQQPKWQSPYFWATFVLVGPG